MLGYNYITISILGRTKILEFTYPLNSYPENHTFQGGGFEIPSPLIVFFRSWVIWSMAWRPCKDTVAHTSGTTVLINNIYTCILNCRLLIFKRVSRTWLYYKYHRENTELEMSMRRRGHFLKTLTRGIFDVFSFFVLLFCTAVFAISETEQFTEMVSLKYRARSRNLITAP